MVVIGCVLVAISIQGFLLPNSIFPGGITGFAAVLQQFIPLPLGVLVGLANVPVFLLAMATFGPAMPARSVVSVVVLSLVVSVAEVLPPLTDDRLLAVVIGGALFGVGVGLVILQGTTTGGTDMLAAVIHKRIPAITIGQGLLFIDSLVIGFSVLTSGQVEVGLYSALTIFVIAQIADRAITGPSSTKAVYIITHQPKLVSQHILREMDRGLTILDGHGGFSGVQQPVLLTLLRKQQLAALKKAVHTIDPAAFVFVTQVNEVLGEGFGKNIFEQHS